MRVRGCACSQGAAQSCATFAAFSWLVDRLLGSEPAHAAEGWRQGGRGGGEGRGEVGGGMSHGRGRGGAALAADIARGVRSVIPGCTLDQGCHVGILGEAWERGVSLPFVLS